MNRLKQGLRRAARAARRGRPRLAAARMWLERNALALTRRRSGRATGRILCYHSIGQPSFGVNDLSPSRFRRHLELALAGGYRFVPAGDIARTGGSPRDLAITFDDATRTALHHAAPLLREYGIPWTLFVVSDWCYQRHPWQREQILGFRDLETLVAQGVEIGSHSATHPDFATLSGVQAAEELRTSGDTLRRNLGVAVTSFAIPFGQSMNWPARATAMARDAGYELIYAQAESTRPPATIGRTFVTRFDTPRIFAAALGGAFDQWEEWM